MPEGHRIGEPFDPDNKPSVFYLDVEEHVPKLLSRDYRAPDHLPDINPSRYFVTSGDAVDKAARLESDLWAAANTAHQQYKRGKKKRKSYCKYADAAWRIAGCARRLTNLLRQVRGSDCFLETEWTGDGTLRCIPKNPRKR